MTAVRQPFQNGIMRSVHLTIVFESTLLVDRMSINAILSDMSRENNIKRTRLCVRSPNFRSFNKTDRKDRSGKVNNDCPKINILITLITFYLDIVSELQRINKFYVFF